MFLMQNQKLAHERKDKLAVKALGLDLGDLGSTPASLYTPCKTLGESIRVIFKSA